MSTQLQESPRKQQYMALKARLEDMLPQIRIALPRHLSAERFNRMIWTQVHGNPMLAQCTIPSVIASAIRAAERGLYPDGRQAALVPYRNKRKGVLEAQFQPMYQGLIDLARRSGFVKDIFPATVCENDFFDWQLGLHRDMVHKPAMKDRGKPVAYYAVAVLSDGVQTFGPGPMTPEDIERIRGRSKAKDDGPWITDYEAMAWKTAIKRLIKYLPQSEELSAAVEDDSRAEFDLPEFKVIESAADLDDAIMGEPVMIGAGSAPELPPDAKISMNIPTWPKRSDQGYIDAAGELYNEERHAAIPRGQTVPTINSDGTFRRRRGTADAPAPKPPSPEETAMAIIAAAVDVETCDDADFEVKDEPAEVQARVHEAADAKRQELAGR